VKRCNSRKKQALTSTNDFSMLESTILPPQSLQSHVLNFSSPSSNEPSSITKSQKNLCKINLCEAKMSKGKTSHLKATSVPSWSTLEIEDVRFVLVSKSKMCAILKKKLESLDKKNLKMCMEMLIEFA